MEKPIVRTLLIEPGKHPKEVYIPNEYKHFSFIVSRDNYYTCEAELLILEKSIGLIRNEEGALLNLKGNRRIGEEIIAGPFFIVGVDDNGYIISLNDEDVNIYKEKFWGIEDYTDAEVSLSYWDKFERTIDEMEKTV